MKTNIILLILIPTIIACFMTTALAKSGKTKRIAILQFKTNAINKKIAQAASDIFEFEIFKIKTFEVIERNRIDLILKEQGFSQTGCVETTCTVQVGKLLSADIIATGNIIQLNKIQSKIIIKLIDVSKGSILFAESIKFIHNTNIEIAIKSISKSLQRKFSKNYISTTFNSSSYYLRGFVPGWSQFYSGNTNKGYIFSSAFTVSTIFAIYGVFNYLDKRSRYFSYNGMKYSIYASKHEKVQEAAFIGRLSLGILISVYTIHWIDTLIFSKPSRNETLAKSSKSYYNFSFTTDINKNNIYYASYGMRY